MGKPYIGVNNVAKSIKKFYIGVNGVAKEVKKAYIGVNGVAKNFWESYQMPSFTGTKSFYGYSGSTPNHAQIFDGATCADAIAHGATKVKIKGHVTWKTTNGGTYNASFSSLYFSASQASSGPSVQNILFTSNPPIMEATPTETTIATFDTEFSINYISELQSNGLNMQSYASQSWAGVCLYTLYADLITFE